MHKNKGHCFLHYTARLFTIGIGDWPRGVTVAAEKVIHFVWPLTQTSPHLIARASHKGPHSGRASYPQLHVAKHKTPPQTHTGTGKNKLHIMHTQTNLVQCKLGYLMQSCDLLALEIYLVLFSPLYILWGMLWFFPIFHLFWSSDLPLNQNHKALPDGLVVGWK